jgi:hypothetical protein
LRVYVRDNSELLNLLEEIEAMEGVRDVIWTEGVETIGRKKPSESHRNLIVPEHLLGPEEKGNAAAMKSGKHISN